MEECCKPLSKQNTRDENRIVDLFLVVLILYSFD
jgi:hypothetical protein